MAAGPACGTVAGRRMVKVEPAPGWLSTATSPPSRWQKWRVRARPRPVPPYRRVVDASACVNASNRRPSCSGVIPIPVSATRNTSQSPAPPSRSPPPWPGSRAAVRVISPRSVNLAALASRLYRAWRTLVRSLRIAPRPSGQSTTSRLPRCRASGAATAATPWTRSATAKSSGNRSIRPASILVRSRMSLISPRRCRPASVIFCRSPPNAAAVSAPRSWASSWSISE